MAAASATPPGPDRNAAILAVSARYRMALADLIDDATEADLATESLCAGWTVRTVAAHLVSALTDPSWAFVVAALRHGGPGGAFDALAKRRATQPPAELAATLRAHATSRFSPPTLGLDAPMTDVLVHTGDVCIPLGRPFQVDPEAATMALDFLTGRAPGFIPRGRLKGLLLAPTDSARRWGSGAPLEGTLADIMLAVCGRRAVWGRLSGEGSAVLAGRL